MIVLRNHASETSFSSYSDGHGPSARLPASGFVNFVADIAPFGPSLAIGTIFTSAGSLPALSGTDESISVSWMDSDESKGSSLDILRLSFSEMLQHLNQKSVRVLADECCELLRVYPLHWYDCGWRDA